MFDRSGNWFSYERVGPKRAAGVLGIAAGLTGLLMWALDYHPRENGTTIRRKGEVTILEQVQKPYVTRWLDYNSDGHADTYSSVNLRTNKVNVHGHPTTEMQAQYASLLKQVETK